MGVDLLGCYLRPASVTELLMCGLRVSVSPWPFADVLMGEGVHGVWWRFLLFCLLPRETSMLGIGCTSPLAATRRSSVTVGSLSAPSSVGLFSWQITTKVVTRVITSVRMRLGFSKGSCSQIGGVGIRRAPTSSKLVLLPVGFTEDPLMRPPLVRGPCRSLADRCIHRGFV